MGPLGLPVHMKPTQPLKPETRNPDCSAGWRPPGAAGTSAWAGWHGLRRGGQQHGGRGPQPAARAAAGVLPAAAAEVGRVCQMHMTRARLGPVAWRACTRRCAGDLHAPPPPPPLLPVCCCLSRPYAPRRAQSQRRAHTRTCTHQNHVHMRACTRGSTLLQDGGAGAGGHVGKYHHRPAAGDAEPRSG